MPYEVSLQGEVLSVRYTGHASFDDVMQAIRFSAGHPDWDDVERILVDFSDITSHAFTRENAIVAAHIGRVAARPGMMVRYALVTTDDELTALCRLYLEHLAVLEWECQIFDDLATARAWLDA